jgi:hypothetical protein
MLETAKLLTYPSAALVSPHYLQKQSNLMTLLMDRVRFVMTKALQTIMIDRMALMMILQVIS